MLETWMPSLLDVLQIFLLTVGFYVLFVFLRGTRTAQILIGVIALFLLIYAFTAFFQLDVVTLILRWFSLLLLLSLLIAFHPEIRRALAMLGRNSYIQILQGQMPETPSEQVVRAARTLAQRRLGALIVIERTNSLAQWRDTGVAIDALFSEELLISIFTPPLPLHDGAIILRGERILSAHCILPIDNEIPLEGVGTRHRAALSLSHECDALILVVSEERGQISIARDGQLFRNLEDRQVERFLRAAFIPPNMQRNFFPLLFGAKHQLPRLLRWIHRRPAHNPSEDANV